MFERFTVEEINLICAFDHDGRDALIAELEAALPDFDEPDMTELAKTVLDRLCKMTDAEFDAFDFYPEFEDYEEQEV